MFKFIRFHECTKFFNICTVSCVRAFFYTKHNFVVSFKNLSLYESIRRNKYSNVYARIELF